MEKRCLRCGNPNVTRRPKHYKNGTKTVWLCQPCEREWYEIYHRNEIECRYKNGAWDRFFNMFLESYKEEDRIEFIKELQRKIPNLIYKPYFE